MKQITLLGEILVDLIGDQNLNFSPVSGGSIFNTASSLAKLEACTSFISQIGDDFWGKYLLDNMSQIGIDVSYLSITKDFKTPLAFAIIDSNGNASYDFYKSKFNLNIENNNFDNTGIFHFGSFFSILEENQQIINNIFNVSKKNDFLISYDPNYRKNFPQSLTKNLINNFKNSSIIKTSFEDLNNIFGANNIKECFTFLKDFNPILAIVTDGKNGAFASINGNDFIKSDCFDVKIVDTIGAGDNFSRGILFFLYKNNIFTKNDLKDINNDSLYKMLSFGNTIAGECLKIKGASIDKQRLLEVKTSTF